MLCTDDASDDLFVTVGKKGLDTLIHYSQLRNNKELEEELTKMNTVTVHVVCRRDNTNPKRKVLKCAAEIPKNKRFRSVSSFLLKYFVVNFGFIVHVDNSFKLIEWISVCICSCPFFIFCRSFESGRWHSFQYTVLFHYVNRLCWYQDCKNKPSFKYDK